MCVFIKKSVTGFCIISVYVHDLKIIGNTQDVDEAGNHPRMEFKMKDLDQTNFLKNFSLNISLQGF